MRLLLILAATHAACFCSTVAMRLESTCEPGEKTIQNVIRLLEEASRSNALSTKSSTNNAPACPGPSGTSSKANAVTKADAECIEIVEKIEKATKGISEKIKKLESIRGHTEFSKSKREIENELKELQSLLPKSSKTIKPQSNCYVNEVNTRLQTTSSNTLITFFVSFMKLKEYGDAETIWLELNDGSQIPTIVDRLYNLQYTEQMAAFSQMVRNIGDRTILYEKWYNLMVSLGHITKDEIIVLRKMILDEGSSIPSTLSSLKTKVLGSTNTVVSRWANSIRSGSYSVIINFASPANRSLNGFCFSDLVGTVVGQAYSTTRSYLWNALVFSSSLRWNTHKYSGLSTMYSKVTTNDKLLVAYRIKLAMENLNGPDGSTTALQSFQSLKNSMASNIRGPVFGRYCFLKSRSYGEYLMGSYYYGDSSNRDIFTYRDGNVLAEAEFKFTPSESGQYIYFYMGSQYWQGEHIDSRSSGGIPALRKSSSYKASLTLEPYSSTYLRIKVGSSYIRPTTSFKDNYLRNIVYFSGSATSMDDWTPTCYE